MTQHPQRRDNVQIRARCEQDLTDLKLANPTLNRCPVIETPEADYRWRIVVQRWKWEMVAANLAQQIDYPNFKYEMARHETQIDKLDMLHRVWDLHRAYQQRRYPEKAWDDDHPRLWPDPGATWDRMLDIATQED